MAQVTACALSNNVYRRWKEGARRAPINKLVFYLYANFGAQLVGIRAELLIKNVGTVGCLTILACHIFSTCYLKFRLPRRL